MQFFVLNRTPVHCTAETSMILNMSSLPYSATKSAGLLASFWNMPMFTQASTDPALSDKSIFTTLVRLGPTFSKMGAAVLKIIRFFEWSRFVMISRRSVGQKHVFCDYASRSIEQGVLSTDMELSDWVKFSEGVTDIELDEILERITRRGRSMDLK